MTHLLLEFELCCGLLLCVRIAVVPEVDSSALSEKQLLEGLLPLALGDLLDGFDLALSAVKHVAVVGDFGPPESGVLLVQVFVLRLQLYQNTLHHRLELLISHCLCFFQHVSKMLVKTVSDVRAALSWRLDAELNAVNVPSDVAPGENYVPKLFYCAQLIESGFVKELHSEITHQASLNVGTVNSSLLEVRDKA